MFAVGCCFCWHWLGASPVMCFYDINNYRHINVNVHVLLSLHTLTHIPTMSRGVIYQRPGNIFWVSVFIICIFLGAFIQLSIMVGHSS